MTFLEDISQINGSQEAQTKVFLKIVGTLSSRLVSPHMNPYCVHICH